MFDVTEPVAVVGSLWFSDTGLAVLAVLVSGALIAVRSSLQQYTSQTSSQEPPRKCGMPRRGGHPCTLSEQLKHS